ncbi:MAG TPA: hypothetical protein VGD56_03075 [Gemmatirosa sp.]
MTAPDDSDHVLRRAPPRHAPPYSTREIPDQPAYWDQLATRVGAGITAAVAADRAAGATPPAVPLVMPFGIAFGRRRWCVPATGAVLAAAAVVAVITFRPAFPSDGGAAARADAPSAWAAAFAASDDAQADDALARRVIAAPAPPAVSALLARGAAARAADPGGPRP